MVKWYEYKSHLLKLKRYDLIGNKAAVFPLQTLGFDVDILNTVQFSNHTGYPSWTGKRNNAEDVQELLDGLEKNELIDEYTHVLTGKLFLFLFFFTVK